MAIESLKVARGGESRGDAVPRDGDVSYPERITDGSNTRVFNAEFLVFIGECVALHLAIIKYQHDIVRWFEYSLEFSQRFLVLQPVRSLRACDHLNAVIW